MELKRLGYISQIPGSRVLNAAIRICSISIFRLFSLTHFLCFQVSVTRINSSGKSHSLSGCLRLSPRSNLDWTLLTLPLGQVVILTIINNMTWCSSWPIINLMPAPRSMTNANGCTYMKCRSLVGVLHKRKIR